MKYFTMRELCQTDTGLSNLPDPHQVKNLMFLADRVLDPAREGIGGPIYATAFRSPAVNAAVRGAVSSRHLLGEAADLRCANNKALFEYIRTRLPFDQLIWEYGDAHQPAWVHVSIRRDGINRYEVLRCIDGKYFRL